nr:lipopolysaccharide biosynthesis protein [uncultured Sphaerochaeta sp.]
MKNKLESDYFNKKVSSATRWSALTQIVVKLIQPITTIILARLLLPEDFGIVANITMIVSFAEMFADAGFSKYIVQHEFSDKNDLLITSLVAFWANIIISVFLFIIIILSRNKLALLIGSVGYEWPLVISGFSIPLFSVVSVQKAIFIRALDFKTLFKIRLFSSLVPFVVSIPIAMIGGGYWALIFGTLCTNIISAVLLTCKSTLKPRPYFNFSILKTMFSFSYWTLIESIVIWLTAWVDIFLINNFLSNYYIGLFKNSISLINALTGVIVATFTPIMFSALARNQNDDRLFFHFYEKNQKIVAYLLFPISIGIYLFRDFATLLMFGPNWEEAAMIVGSWGFASGFVIVFSGFSSEVYRAKGKPKISVMQQSIWIAFIIPLVLIGVRQSFEIFIYYRVVARFSGILIAFVLMKVNFGVSPVATIRNVIAPIFASASMGVFAVLLKEILPVGILFQFINIFLCIIFYYLFVRLAFKKDYVGIIAYLFNK